MKSKNTKIVIITKRDIELFRYLHFFKVAAIKQVKRDLFSGVNRNTFYWRIRKLEDFGYIQRGRTISRRGQCLSITQKCFDEFISTGDEVRVELMSKSLEHDLTLVDICHELKKSPKVKRYFSENELQTWKKYQTMDDICYMVDSRSDACVLLKFDNGEFWIPIEYESSSKSERRYREIIEDIYAQTSSPAVFYICKNDAVLRKIQKVERKYFEGKREMLYYKLIDDLKHDSTIMFKSLSGKMLLLGS